MRLWTLHPRHLDRPGLTGCWRESLLAQAVLAGRTTGYRSHPQLERFRAQEDPIAAVGAYLEALAEEAAERGYRFDRSRIDRPRTAADQGAAGHGPDGHGDDGAPVSVGRIPVTEGQIAVEWEHLLLKLSRRDPERWERESARTGPELHPLFEAVPGDVEPWERAAG
ncbi:pyrimidine dimer DNA glycosylase/endonuclease V [Brachybacterium alimentarium]|uniref:pyrimidine dimer DNA glycosylase/endonuclease V n=1 Tax=Brachybacterium alimentarium TaxID=47845 RepID=UPI000DF45130|nr:pyrimidine dimer DNA glycosylase/endonuclease V [Brachybacterium alimentarium]RCS76967.1 pyrimidine dimer DNA glycosylase [Brachybacterium alimentarium]RCS81995.1 pyrimidine dimer DNA glycosylase [Brachybacterium alimentarium]RCS84194.1 pyrimidine dimer DNA glycosylase [Brachybacterium alimentarium]